MTKARQIALLVFSAILFVGLVSLAYWQLQRLDWKNNLIAQSKAAVMAKPVTITDIEAGLEYGYDANFLRVKLNGFYRHDLERYVYRSNGKKPGFHVITPFLEKAGYIVLVDRGWVNQKNKNSASRQSPRQPQGNIAITGVTRNHPTGWKMFIPPADKLKKIWYWYDRADLANSLPAGLGATENEQQAVIASMFVQVEPGGEPATGTWPQSPPVTLKLTNNHLQYALTWFALALVLLIMTGYYFWTLRKNTSSKDKPDEPR